MEKIYIDLDQVKTQIDAVFNDKEIEELIKQNGLEDFDNEDLEELFYDHINAEAPFSEDGYIVLSDDVNLYIESNYKNIINSTQLITFIRYKIYSNILQALT